MTTKERVKRTYNRQEIDRIPITDHPWEGTINRWKREGMPQTADWREFFGVDKFELFQVDVSPQYKRELVEETETYTVSTTEFGVTLKYLKGEDATPEFLDYTVTDPAKWEEAKKRINHDTSRINWDFVKKNLPAWNAEGRWIDALFWFGYDITHSWMVGMEAMLIGMLEEPEWAIDMFNTMLDANIALFDQVWDAGYRFDGLFMYDDMGYKNSQFFSIDTYRELLKPAHKRAYEWAANKGIPSRLHSCGMVEPFVPELIEIGLNALNPLEVKAGMDPIHIKRTYGDKIVLHGGINAVLWDKPAEIKAEIERVVPILKEGGGYIFSSDHSIPNAVGLEDFKNIVALVKKIGAY